MFRQKISLGKEEQLLELGEKRKRRASPESGPALQVPAAPPAPRTAPAKRPLAHARLATCSGAWVSSASFGKVRQSLTSVN